MMLPNKPNIGTKAKRLTDNDLQKMNALIDKWIKEMHEAGLSFDQMLEVFKLAKHKLKFYKKINKDQFIFPKENITNE